MMIRFSVCCGLAAVLALAFGCSADASDSGGTQQMSSNPTGNNAAGSGSANGGNPAGGSGSGTAGSSSGDAPTADAGSPDDPVSPDPPYVDPQAPADAGACYSPTQNTDTAYTPGAQGCFCDDGADDVCISGVALICTQGRWLAVEDGPCEPMAGDGCAAQDVMMVGGCEPAPVYFWNGTECIGQSGCSCEGTDCDNVFPSQEACLVVYGDCGEGEQGCGGFLGDTCSDDEYCAYQPGQLCGAADASATCMPRPTICTREYAPVCGCDGMTYGNECEANAAGVGVLSLGECE